ncbi:glycoside hydrolase family 79 protein [Lepidopterella palustris CBS 459.81]|uniref:Glycoside hydrolase family 79 protein n=1 Tax=Lepidopterella palustris CBS 459.81 TaxID=1314670 RepID=A0A8E2EAW0_9PEZI|nr:glycoside hydrolase family 79 protein [Lepidopterella palustris CBS 459.81]
MSPWRNALLFLALAVVSTAQNVISLSPASNAAGAAGLSSPLNPSFAGFGIEPSNLYSFTGRDYANQLSVNLLQNLADYSGAPPHIRIGGNTGDYMIYNASYNDYSLENNVYSVGEGVIASDSMIFGPSYFKALDRFPKNTPITYGLNLAYQQSDYLDNIVKEARAALNGMTNVKLVSFEIGNEPDLYLQNNFRTGSWGGQVYTEQFLERAAAVYQQVLRPAGIPSSFFEGPATASTIGTTFDINGLVQYGLTATTNGSNFISAWNQHDYFYFIGVSNVPLTLNDLMNLDNTNSQFAYWETQVAAGLVTGLPYVLREMCSVGPIGVHGISDTFGAALWTLNFFMYTASLNISSVQMHMTDNSNVSAWQPINMYGNAPFVRPMYYAHAAVAQLVGNGNGTTQIGALNTNRVSSSYTGRIRAYAAYANGLLRSLVLINSFQANSSDTNKGSYTFTFSLPSYSGQYLYLSYLTAAGADALSATTWNGISFESSSSGTPKTVNSTLTTLTIGADGKISVAVRDSEAVIANIGWPLGANEVLVPNSTSKTGPAVATTTKKSAAPVKSVQGTMSAVIGGAVTTTVALMGSVSNGVADATGSPRPTVFQAVITGGLPWLGFIFVAREGSMSQSRT